MGGGGDGGPTGVCLFVCICFVVVVVVWVVMSKCVWINLLVSAVVCDQWLLPKGHTHVVIVVKKIPFFQLRWQLLWL